MKYLLLFLLAIVSASCEKAEASCAKGEECDQDKAAVPEATAPRCPPPECLADDVDFMDSLQELHTAESLKGKVVVLNYWATWCKPCKKEIPAFNAVYDKYKDKGVLMLGLNTDLASNIDLLNFMSDWEMTYPAVMVDEKIVAAYDVPSNIPTTYIYDKRGKRVRNQLGGMSEQELSAVLDKLLAQ